MAGHPRPLPVPTAPPLRWWTLVLPAVAFVLLFGAVAGTRPSGPSAVPPVVELLGHIRTLLPDALAPST